LSVCSWARHIPSRGRTNNHGNTNPPKKAKGTRPHMERSSPSDTSPPIAIKSPSVTRLFRKASPPSRNSSTRSSLIALVTPGMCCSNCGNRSPKETVPLKVIANVWAP